MTGVQTCALPISAYPLCNAQTILSSVNTYNLLLVVRSAGLAHSVRYHKHTASAALYQSGSTHFPVCSPLIPSAFGRFILRTNRHCYTSLFLKISCITAMRGSGTNVSHPQSLIFRFCPHTGHIPLQSSLHRIFTGQLIKISLCTKASVSR